MTRCLLAFGSNLGDRHAILAQACAEVEKLPGCQLLARSRWHATVPIGGAAGQGEFLNGAVLLETALESQQLANALKHVETSLGRQRTNRWDARTIDIDVLLVGQQVIDTEVLIVPHPRMAFRKFVLEPAVEIAGAMLHPTSGWTISRLLAHLQNSPRYVVVTAAEKPIADWLVSCLSQKMNCTVIFDSSKNSGSCKNREEASVLQLDKGLEFPCGSCGKPPVLATCSHSALATLVSAQVSQKKGLRPALVIALEGVRPKNLRAEAASAGFVTEQEKDQTPWGPWLDYPGLGPLARITVDDPAAVLQEAQAALRCIWPDIGNESKD